jgi:integrase
MTIKKTESGWLADCRPHGRNSKRFRKTFKTKAEAAIWEAWVKTEATQNAEWKPERRDLRKLSDLVDLWHQNHGSSLKASADTYQRLKNLCKALGEPLADQFDAEMFTAYRSKRIEAGTSANTVNHEHAYMRSVFNELTRLGHWKKDNPLKLVRAFKVDEQERRYLEKDELIELLQALDNAKNLHVGMIARICLETGARWAEAENLVSSQVKNGLIQYSGGKSGKHRAVPIRLRLERQLRVHLKRHGCGDRFFDDSASRWAFREAIKNTSLKLPEGQMTHVMRHTFASYFMIAGGNILALQKLLGHQSLTMTMRYAHLSPDHLVEARKFNPLAVLALS